MKDYNKQIYSIEKEKYGWFKINSNVKIIKAIVFTSFISYEENDFKENIRSTMSFKIRFIQNNND